MKRWQWAVRLLTRRIWFRAALFCLFAVALALAGALIGHAISYQFAASVGAKSVDNILNVLASSMLAVTTFSLTAMVSAYSGATSNITPRAVQLLIEDSTAQNALATFLGSFLFAIVGIIALSTGVYGETGRVILYGGTVLVIVVIVVTFIRWIEHIAKFGRVSDTIDRVERAATDAVRKMTQAPRFGPRAHHRARGGQHRPTYPHRTRHPRRRRRSGDRGWADRRDHSSVGVAGNAGRPGAAAGVDGRAAGRAAGMPHPGGIHAGEQPHVRSRPPLRSRRPVRDRVARAVPGGQRPGTAIAVLEAGTRVLTAMLRHDPGPVENSDDVVVPPFAFAYLIEDLYRPIARDGAGTIEVGIRLQKSLAALSAVRADADADCRREAEDVLDRARRAFESDRDGEWLARIHDRYWPAGTVAG